MVHVVKIVPIFLSFSIYRNVYNETGSAFENTYHKMVNLEKDFVAISN